MTDNIFEQKDNDSLAEPEPDTNMSEEQTTPALEEQTEEKPDADIDIFGESEILSPQSETEENPGGFAKELFGWADALVSAIILVVLLLAFVFDTTTVDGTSMMNTLHDTEKVVISNLFFTPKRGDIIVISKKSFRDGFPIVKRVIALEGQTVNLDISTGTVSVDGVALDEPYTAEPTYNLEDTVFPVTVPEGKIFVMGDNRNLSMDSRSNKIGFIDEREILGRVIFRLFPLNKFGTVS